MHSGLIKIGLDALYYCGAHTMMSQFSRGMGVIFTLHRVREYRERSFQPNAILEVTPEFLENMIIEVRKQGYEFVSLDEAERRIAMRGSEPPFACLTFDDGYRDNRDVAFPILKKHGCPFAIYVTTSFSDGNGQLWWVAVEEIIRGADSIEIAFDAGPPRFETATPREKEAAFLQICKGLQGMGGNRRRKAVDALAARHDFDLAGLCQSTIMGWDELVDFARYPLLTIGAHTVHHYALARLSEAEARAEIADSVEIIGNKLWDRPRHFSFPYGNAGSAGAREFAIAAELGLKTAVTTRKGMIFAEHGQHMTALPRVSLNGNYQSPRYLELFLSGAPFVLWNGFRRLNVA